MNNKIIKDKSITIALAADMKYSEQVTTLIKSICYHHKDQKIKFYMLHKEYPDEWFEFINYYLNLIGHEIISVKILNDRINDFKKLGHITEAAYYRYFIEALPEERILYLDSDIVVNGNLSDFYYQDFQDKFIVAITDIFLNESNHFRDIRPYFNSGVLLINNQKWKEHNVHKLLMEATELHSKDIVYGDQDILNILLHKHCLFDDKIYNYQTGARFCFYILGLYEVAEELEKVSQEPIIIHYTSHEKPWLATDETRFREKYWFYYKLEWQDILKLHSE